MPILDVLIYLSYLPHRVDNFWPWVQNKAENATTYFGKQHFRSGNNIAAPRDGVPIDSNDAATDTIPDNEDNAIPDTARKYLSIFALLLFIIYYLCL
jgi:hypothetical protein